MKRIAWSVIIMLSMIAGFSAKMAIADSPTHNGSPATATVNIRITPPTSINIHNVGSFSLDIPSIITGIANGFGEFSVATNYASGVTVTIDRGDFSPTLADTTAPAITIAGGPISEPVITVALAFGATGVATANGSIQLAAIFAVPKDTRLALTRDNDASIALLDIATAADSLPTPQNDSCLSLVGRASDILSGHISKITSELGANYASGIVYEAEL